MNGALHMLVRAALAYSFLLLVLRLAGKRSVREGTPLDWLVAAMLSDLPGGVIYGHVPLAQGAVAVVTLLFLHLLVAQITVHSAAMRRVVDTQWRTVIAHATRIPRAMAAEHINAGDLDALLRQSGIDDLREVERAIMEPSGTLSVLRVEPAKPVQRRDLPRLPLAKS